MGTEKRETAFPKRLLVFAAASLIFALGFAYAEETPMTPDEIKSAWVGKKLLIRLPTNSGVNPYHYADWYLKADGTTLVEGTGWSHNGSWRASKEGYCTKYPTLASGEERCYTVVKNGSTFTIYRQDKSVATEVLKVVDL